MNEINSNISPSEIAELNYEDAKQFDTAIGVIINDMPAKLTNVKSTLDNVETKIKSLKTKKLTFNITNEMEYLVKDYDEFSNNVLNYAGYYELEILKVINIFDRQNSLDGNLSVDNNNFRYLPFLGTILFTLMSGINPSQITLDVVGEFMDSRDFNASLGNLMYNGLEYGLGNVESLYKNVFAAVGLIAFETFYEWRYTNTDPRQWGIALPNAGGDATKLVIGNIVADWAKNTFIAYGVKQAFREGFFTGIVRTALAVGVVVISESLLDKYVDPVVQAFTGEIFIYGTSIPENGGLRSLYSDYVRSTESFSYSQVGRTTSVNGMTVSYEYCHALAQYDPIETLKSMDDYNYDEFSYNNTLLKQYLDDLKSIPKDSENYQQRINDLTANSLIGNDGSGNGSDYIRSLIYDLDFDPYTYAINN